MRIAAQLAPVASSVAGTTRSEERLPLLQQQGIDAVQFNGEQVNDDLLQALNKATHIVVSVSPSNAESLVLDALQQQSAATSTRKWIGYLSTVGVYGDHQGRWIDEDSACSPGSGRTAARLQSEQLWQNHADQNGASIAIFRLPGIYGPGRNALRSLRNGNARRILKPGQVFNRVHVDDIATAVSLAAKQHQTGIYNISDDLPAAAADVTAYAAQLMNIEPPEPIAFATAVLSPMARSFYAQNKRVCNARSKTIAGMRYQYPDYHSGLRSLWQSGSWNQDV